MNIFNVFYEPTGMSRDELKSLQAEAYRRFYGRPDFLAKKLGSLTDRRTVRRTGKTEARPRRANLDQVQHPHTKKHAHGPNK